MSAPDPAFSRVSLAHRGLHDAALRCPENSLPAMRRAVEMGYGIELDVQGSADGVAMVFHDHTLDRMTAHTGPLRAQAAHDLERIGLRGSDATIPRLADVLAAVDGAVPVLIEIKDQSGGNGAGPDDLERAVAADLADYAGPVAVMSFNPHAVAAMARLAPDVPRGLVSGAFTPQDWPGLTPRMAETLRDITAYDDVGATFVSHDWRDLDNPRVAALKSAGAAILCWTIKSPEAEATARRIADTITFEGYLPPLAQP